METDDRYQRAMSPSFVCEALQQSPMEHPAAAPELPPEISLPEASQRRDARAEVPAAPPGLNHASNQALSLLSDTSGIDADEEYSNDERMLNDFIKQHPMLSLEATSVKTMQLVAGMMEKAHIPVPEL